MNVMHKDDAPRIPGFVFFPPNDSSRCAAVTGVTPERLRRAQEGAMLLFSQCTNSHREGSEFCGIHMRGATG
jgi:hypothetical protein